MATTLCGHNDGPGVKGTDLLLFRGPILFVKIGFDPNYKFPGTPVVPDDIVHALVDTGATECCIDSKLAMELQLPIIDRRRIAGSAGAHEVNVHLAHIFVPSLNFTVAGAFAAVDLAAGGQQSSALMGRTFLQHFRMLYDGFTGTVSISNDPLPKGKFVPEV